MKTQRFDELDRERAIEELQRHLGVRLTRRGSRRKLLADDQGRQFIVMGGYEEWHGIPGDVMEAARNDHAEWTLVIARRSDRTIRVYAGPMGPLLHATGLSVNREGQFEFEVVWRGDSALIKQAPGARLQLLTELDFSSQDREAAHSAKEFTKRWSQLSPQERNAVLDSLAQAAPSPAVGESE
jgi:hypothetical protein